MSLDDVLEKKIKLISLENFTFKAKTTCKKINLS